MSRRTKLRRSVAYVDLGEAFPDVVDRDRTCTDEGLGEAVPDVLVRDSQSTCALSTQSTLLSTFPSTSASAGCDQGASDFDVMGTPSVLAEPLMSPNEPGASPISSSASPESVSATRGTGTMPASHIHGGDLAAWFFDSQFEQADTQVEKTIPSPIAGFDTKVKQVMADCECLKTIHWTLAREPEQLVDDMFSDSFYAAGYFGITTHPMWRMYDCAAGNSKGDPMVPHCFSWAVMHVIWVGSGKDAGLLERRLIAKSRPDCRIRNIRPGGEMCRSSDEVVFVYVCTNSLRELSEFARSNVVSRRKRCL